MKNIVVIFKEFKLRNEKLIMFIVYDYLIVKIIDEVGINGILVGDFFGMVCLGYEDIFLVIMEDMIYYIRVVIRGVKNILVVVDMLFMFY